MLPTLVRQLRDKDTVIFHCALSQQRGPNAALRYLRERDRILATDAAAAGETTTAGPTLVGVAAADVDGVGAGESGGVSAADAAVAAAAAATAGTREEGGEGKGKKTQQVLVLDRGFVGWQEEFGTDERLTEGYREELWKDGYWG